MANRKKKKKKKKRNRTKINISKKNTGEIGHDILVFDLERLVQEMDYKRIQLFYEYCRNGFCGEVDLLAFAEGYWDFYEVKTHLNEKSLKKAKEQYSRFRMAYRDRDIGGYVYSSDRIILPL